MITRSKLASKFAQISNSIHEAGLSAEAVGILCYLLSKPEGWQVHVTQLAAHFHCSKDRIYWIMKELKIARFLGIAQERGSNGRFQVVDYEVQDKL